MDAQFIYKSMGICTFAKIWQYMWHYRSMVFQTKELLKSGSYASFYFTYFLELIGYQKSNTNYKNSSQWNF